MRKILTVRLVLGLLMTAAPAAADSDADPRRTEAVRLQEEGDAAAAAELWEAIVAEGEDDGEAWFALGNAYLDLEASARGAAAFARAARAGYAADISWYNAACGYALSGNTADAVAAVDAALKAGFSRHGMIMNDPDLASIRDTPELRAVWTPPVYTPDPHARPVVFPAADGPDAEGVFYAATDSDRAAEDRSRPVILLFHQSGSNHAEYQPIAPRLNAAGYHCLAVDARGGGWAYGRDNPTEQRWQEENGRRGTGREAVHDFAGALHWVRSEGFTGPVVAWGSSYSAGRMFFTLVENPDQFAAALAFSPGALFARQTPEGGPSLAERTVIPVFMTWSPEEIDDERRARAEALAHPASVLHVPEHGEHGAATLRPDRNAEGWEANWEPVLEFLQEHVPAG